MARGGVERPGVDDEVGELEALRQRREARGHRSAVPTKALRAVADTRELVGRIGMGCGLFRRHQRMAKPFSNPTRHSSRVVNRRRASASVSAASAHTQIVAIGADTARWAGSFAIKL